MMNHDTRALTAPLRPCPGPVAIILDLEPRILGPARYGASARFATMRS
jgi:hypothetical protein